MIDSREVDAKTTGDDRKTSRATLLKVFVALAAATVLLRIFYSAHLYQDDGLWLTAAEELLRGKALYREIYFDKPPALPLVYALLFKLFGAHVLTIRLFTIAYSLAISALLYLFGCALYCRRAGMLAAAAFTIFSTTYTTGHVQGLNTDFMMALPYTAAAYFLIRSRLDAIDKNAVVNNRAWLTLAGGALAGVAFQVNPKAAFDLVFFALFLIAVRKWSSRRASSSYVKAMALAALGFAAGAAAFVAYVAAQCSLSAYWLYVWDWGARYSSYYSWEQIALTALKQTAGYFALNNTLLVTLIFVAVVTIKGLSRSAATAGESRRAQTLRADATLLIWLAASYLGMAMGGRFYGHYFFQIMPALSLIAARGIAEITTAPFAFNWRGRELKARRVVIAALAAGFLFTLVRFHGRTIALAADWARGAKSEMTQEWFHERLKREEQMAAASVRDAPGGGDGEHRAGSDYLFVWGYRPEIYYWSGLLPASRYLSTQPLTGVPADVHYFGWEYRSLLDEAATEREREKLLADLQQTRPRYIIDELGFFNSELAIEDYAELREFMREYRNRGTVGRFIIYRRRDAVGKERKPSDKQ
jgi:hypothetical protein